MNNINSIDFVILALAVYRVTHLFLYDSIMQPLRNIFMEWEVKKVDTNPPIIYITIKEGRIRSFIGRILSCYWCSGVWFSAIAGVSYYFAPIVTWWVCLVLALSSVQSIIETIWFKMLGTKIVFK